MKKALLLTVLILALLPGCTRGFKAWTSQEPDLGFATVNVSTNWGNAGMFYTVNIFPRPQGGLGKIEGEMTKAIKKDDDTPRLIFHFLDKNKNEIFKTEAPLKDIKEEADKRNRSYYTYENTIECPKKTYNKISNLRIKWNF